MYFVACVCNSTVNATLSQGKLSDGFLYKENKVGNDFIKTTCYYQKNTNVYTNLINIEMRIKSFKTIVSPTVIL